ncbi:MULTISPECIES: hypothetical protein [Paenibacillus]|nr:MULTISPECIES: hypothetical protein [Paenibacillus]
MKKKVSMLALILVALLSVNGAIVSADGDFTATAKIPSGGIAPMSHGVDH